MPRETLKDNLSGNELDLSLSDLTIVPVKEMAALPKGTRVDLSCNLLTALPLEFSSLSHIVKLDLSKNKLESLPDDFGDLQKLQHLDLYGNKLSTLPVSFFRLKNLKWLDLRDNPLTEDIKKVAGDCLNEAECKQCAKNVLAYMKNVQADLERKRQKKLQAERELEAEKKAEEESERQRKKADKLAEKERRRQEFKAKQAAKELEETPSKTLPEEEPSVPSSPVSNGSTATVETKQKSSWSCCSMFFMTFFSLAFVLVAAYYYCDTHQKDAFCTDARKHLLLYWNSTRELIERYTKR